MPRASLFALVVPLLLSTAAGAKSPPAFDPDAAKPYFADGPAAAAMRRLRAEDWAGAARGFQEYLASLQRSKAADAAPARFLAAWALSKSGRFTEAAELFDGLVRDYPLLADYERLYAARALLAAKQYEKSLERSRAVSPATPLDAEARFARAEALRLMGLRAEAEREYRGYLAAYPKSWREPEVRFRLAEQLDDKAASAPREARGWADAKALYREVYIRFPTESWAKQAEARLRAVEPEALALSGAEQITRGLALFDEMRNEQSEAAFKAALAGGQLTAMQQCTAAYHLAQSVFKERNRPRAAPLFDDAVSLCEKASKEDPAAADLHAKSLYQGARCHAAKNDIDQALALYARLEQEHPQHSFADDSRLRASELHASVAESLRALTGAGKPVPPELLGGKDALAAMHDHLKLADELLADLPERYPTGDEGGEALFRLGFRALRDGRFDDAKKWLDKELKMWPREDGWWEAGRTLYWLGRVADAQGRPDEARARFEQAVREYPLAYYALAALNRLRERWPDAEKKLVESLRPKVSEKDLAWRFAPRPLFGEPGFQRGVELLRLGLGAEAKREFAALGIKSEKGAKPQTPEQEELLWLAAVLYDRAGQWAQSHEIPRHVLTAYADKWPVGDNRKRWLLSYPRGFADLVVEKANENGQPPALEFAIIREESAFDPSMESFANAVGLTQLTPPPAKRFAKGLPYSREALRDPVINVTIGAREMGDLWQRTHGAAALAIAGYNAGEGAVHRWLKGARAGETLDEFIEAIPYDETRGYTKRVLSSFFAYRWLYDDGDPVPPLPQPLPR